MKKLIHLIGLSMLILGCAPKHSLLIGGDKDAQGCLPSAGQSWSVLKQQCVQSFNVADIKLDDPDNETLAIYVILSADKQQAEIFKADLPNGTVFEAVKGGYISKDRTMKLMKFESGWKFLRK